VPVCKWECKTETCQVPVCKKSWVCETVQVPVCKTRCVPECKTETYTVCVRKCVPYQATRTVCCKVAVQETVKVCKMVPHVVEKQVPACGGCGNNCGNACGNNCGKGCGDACGNNCCRPTPVRDAVAKIFAKIRSLGCKSSCGCESSCSTGCGGCK
jgi:hypothetical protein